MSSEGTRARTRGRNYVLPLAIVLVVGQIAAFVAIKMSKDDKPAADTPQPAIAANDVGGSGSSVATLDVPPAQGSGAPTEVTPPTAPPTAPDQPVADTENPTEPAPVVDPPVIDEKIHDDDSEEAKKAKRELAKQKAIKEKAEKAAREKQEKAEKAERDRREAEDKRREADAKRATDVEKARLAAEAEKARLAAEKAKAEAAAEQARLEQEKLKAAAAEKQVAATSTEEKPKGSSSVLVLVLGPGVSSPSREAIRNVYLGKTSVWPNGTTAHPMNRPSGSAAGRKFFGGILGMSGGEFKEHWSELQLSGGGIAPSTVSSATTMVAKVAATRGGMGYVLESELPENTKGVTLVRLK